ncbi:ABC transporter substrate-binding protein [Nocardioides ultimimeridianus]
MLKKTLAAVAVTASLAGGLSACGGGSHTNADGTPIVKIMVGGLDKQIYLPFTLAKQLGYYDKYGVDVQLSDEVDGGVGAEDAMASGQVDMAGAWYIHSFDFQAQGKDVEGIVQLGGAPGEREMCATDSGVHSGADYKDKTMGVTDLGSGTDELTQFIAAKAGVAHSDYHTQAVGSGSSAVAQIQQGSVDCVMTTQPTVAALEKKGLAYSAVDLATTAGANQALGGAWPAATALARTDWVNSHKTEVQGVVSALVATLNWMHTHTPAQIADKMPADYVQNDLITKADYIKALTEDFGQYTADGIMPPSGPAIIADTEKTIGTDVSNVDPTKTYTDEFAKVADQQLGIQ